MDAHAFYEAMKADLAGKHIRLVGRSDSHWRGWIYEWGNHRVRMRYNKFLFDARDWSWSPRGWAAYLDPAEQFRICEVKLYTGLKSSHSIAECIHRSDGSTIWVKGITSVDWMKLKLMN